MNGLFVILLICFFGVLITIAYQDCKERAIYWFLPLLLVLASAGMNWFWKTTHVDWLQYGLNFGFLIFQFLVVSALFSFRERKLKSVVPSMFAWGDVLFLLPLCILFPFRQFILFYSSALILVLLGFLLVRKWKPSVETVPFAGGMAIYLMIWMVFDPRFLGVIL